MAEVKNLNKQEAKMVDENNNCIFPKCPKCGKGFLLPFSFKEDVFEKWKCSNSECGYIVKKHDRDRM